MCVYGLLPFAKHPSSGDRIDCLRISSLQVLHRQVMPRHNELVARWLPITLACSEHTDISRFCRRRSDRYVITLQLRNRGRLLSTFLSGGRQHRLLVRAMTQLGPMPFEPS